MSRRITSIGGMASFDRSAMMNSGLGVSGPIADANATVKKWSDIGGSVRVGTRLPSVGQPIQSMLATWHQQFPEVELSVFELNEREILTGIEERRLNVALMTQHKCPIQSGSIAKVFLGLAIEPSFRDKVLAASRLHFPAAPIFQAQKRPGDIALRFERASS